jgi:hypothetical protein
MPVHTNSANASTVPATPSIAVTLTGAPDGSVASTGLKPLKCAAP